MTKPDLTGIRIIHRAMRGDLHRLVALTEAASTGQTTFTPARAAALAAYIGQVRHAIHVHHTREDEIVWPLLERSAGAAVDLADLSEDHSVLDPLLAEMVAAADAFANGTGQPGALASAVRKLSDLLDEHIEEEERRIFPVIQKYVTGEEWEQTEKKFRKGGDVRFELAWVSEYTTPEERAFLRAKAGPMLTLMLALIRPGHRRRQRLLFGSAA
ncbi:hemerythrin domain-containing protein [Acrocarpospora catenulata]|uniref:hemerythrin domain-containing protein n=1 Tax=Acrocarpospora catenulata TaxID=2836182 RepID=UPI001BD98839|nr:hemerythrin domain-containing protein [Acrocarpospora catenulata]